MNSFGYERMGKIDTCQAFPKRVQNQSDGGIVVGLGVAFSVFRIHGGCGTAQNPCKLQVFELTGFLHGYAVRVGLTFDNQSFFDTCPPPFQDSA